MNAGQYQVRRRRAYAAAARAARVDSFLVTRPADVRYLTGFTGEDSYLLVRRGGGGVLLTDGRFQEQARKECGCLEAFIRSGAMSEAVAKAARDRRLRRLAVQGGHMTLSLRDALDKTGAVRRLVPVGDVVGDLRVVKDAGELAAIEKAVRVAERAFRQLLATGRRGWVGRRERELAAELDYRMRLAGAEGPSFETIVAVGPHASLPHYRPGAARIRDDRLVLIDWGARVGGYCSDLTRVVAVGRIPSRLAEVYDVVRRSQEAGIAACRAGARASAVDRAARKVVESAGLGKRFVHGLGHGVGLAIHEPPSVSGQAKGRLRAGMVVTVEPGVYLPGVGGVRIEDDVVVVRGGCRRLGRLARDLPSMTLR